jgi:hypothetical protein
MSVHVYLFIFFKELFRVKFFELQFILNRFRYNRVLLEERFNNQNVEYYFFLFKKRNINIIDVFILHPRDRTTH